MKDPGLWLLWGGSIAIVAVLVGIVIMARHCSNDKHRLIDECLAAGKANYECQAMFSGHCKSGGGSPVIVPVRF